MADDLLSQILRDYPMLGFLLQDPEVAALIIDAVNPDHTLDTATFQLKLMNTNWWKTSSAAQREWEVKAATDPATAAQQMDLWKFQLNQAASQAGIQLAQADLDWWANFYLPRGIQVTDPRIGAEIARVYSQRPDLHIGGGGAPAGNIGAIGDQIKQLGSTYLRDLTDQDVAWWQQEIAAGNQTLQGLQTVLKNQSKDRFGFYAEQIDEGATPEQLFADRRDAIARELEMSPTAVDLLHDPRWSKVLGVTDKDGVVKPMSYAEAISLARSQDEWKVTANARDQASMLGQQLLQTLGAVK